jgi:hypothetical protein
MVRVGSMVRRESSRVGNLRKVRVVGLLVRRY